MSDTGTAIIYCETCGAKLPARAPLGLCPRCMLREATAHGEEGGGESAVLEESEALAGDEIENYALLRQLGEGGFGVVYEAEQQAPVKRRVALKILKPGMNSRQILARFGAERQALALLEHPFIAKVYDAGETARGLPYFAMELVEGEPLTEFCASRRLGLKQRIELFVRICQGVQHAHQKGIIHRDLKPANILVEGVRREGSTEKSTTALRPLPRIIDFGIARATEQLLSEATLLTNAAQVLGTPGYMSPEQAAMNTEAIDTRSDVYSLGAILYELLTGTLPFTREELQDAPFDEMLRRIREEDPPKPSHRANARGSIQNERIPPDLDWITLKALRKKPAERYSSVAELAADLERFLGDEPISARPPSALYLCQKFIARHKTATATILAAGLTLLVGSIVSTVLYLRAEQQAERAAQSEQKEKETFSRSDFLGSEQLLHDGQAAEAVAQLVRAIRTDPANTAAKFKLLATLAYTDFIQPTHPPLEDELKPYRITMSKDGALVAVCSELGRVRVREVASGETVRILEHKSWVTSIAFHPTERNWFLTSSRDRTAALWDLSSGQRLRDFPHRGPLEWAAFTPGGDRVLTHASDGTACVWEARTGRKIATLPHGGTINGEYAAALAPDGRSVVLATGPTARIWSLESFQPIGEPLVHDSWITDLVVHPRGLVATGGLDRTARVWDLSSGEPLTEPLRHTGRIFSLAFSPDGSRLLTGTGRPDNAARIWDLRLQQAVLPPMRHGERIHNAFFSPDGRRVMTTGYTDGPNDAAIRVWYADSASPASAPVYLSRGVRLAAMNKNGDRLVTTSRDGLLRQWDLRPRAAQPLILRHRDRIWFTTFTADSEGLAIWTGGRTPQLWETARGRPARGRSLTEAVGWTGRNLNVGGTAMGRHEIHVSALLPPALCEGSPHGFAFTSDGKTLITGGHDGFLRFWDFAKRKQTRAPVSLGAPIWAVAIAGDDSMIAAGTGGEDPNSGAVHWFARDGTPRGSVAEIGTPIYELALPQRNSATIAAGFRDGTVRIISTIDGTEKLAKVHADRVQSLAFSPNGRWLASGSADNTAILWDLETRSLHHHLTGHIDRATYGIFVRFSPDSRFLITTASHDDTTRVWNVSSGEQVGPAMRSDETVQDLDVSSRNGFVAVGHPVRILDPHTGSPLMHEMATGEHLSSISFSPDERRVVAGGWNGTAMVWDLPPCGLELPEWFLRFAEAHAGLRYRERGELEAIDSAELAAAREAVLGRSGDDDLTRWARWLATDPTPGKPASPWTSLTRQELADHLAGQATAISIHRALDLAPEHAVGHAMLAWRIAVQQPNRSQQQEADFLSHYAITLAPRDPEVWKLRSETLRRLGRPSAADAALEHAKQLNARGFGAGAAEILRRARELIRGVRRRPVR